MRENLSALIISGRPPELELAAAWQRIKFEYIDARGDLEFKAYAGQLKEQANRLIDYQQINLAIKELGNMLVYGAINEEVIKYRDHYQSFLNGILRTQFNFDFNEEIEFVEQLTRARNRSKGLKLQIDLMKARLEAVEQKFANKKKPDEMYYRSLLITLSDEAGYQLTDSITVFEFIERLRRLESKISKQQPPPKGKPK